MRCHFSWMAIFLTMYPCPANCSEPTLEKLSIQPSKILLSGKAAKQQLQITGLYSDGSVKDLTAQVEWKSNNPAVAKLIGSIVMAAKNGQTEITARYQSQSPVIAIKVKKVREVRSISFRNDVMPLFSKHGCNAGTCHGNFNGKNGFRLSLRGEDPQFDLTSLKKDTLGRRINRLHPRNSLLLQKPTGHLPHEGSIRFSSTSEDYQILYKWIAEGSQPDPMDTPKLIRLKVYPRDRVLLNGVKQQQILAHAFFDDGSNRDVTRFAAYEPSSEIVSITSSGQVTAHKSGEVTIVVRYLDKQVPCRLAFVPPRPNFVWKQVPERNYIDKHIFHRLKELRIEPSLLADDSVFLRRAYLDVCGILPTPREVKEFLKDKAPDKRSKLIDRLLERPEYADFWALKWADLLRNEEKAVDAKGVRHFHHWIRQSISQDKPLDQFVRELLTGRGSTYAHPQANYYRTNLTPQKAAETTARLFMGVRIACARCHNHPFDRWTQGDYYGMAAFFARVRTKMLDNNRRDRRDKHQLNGEMVVWFSREGEVENPQTGGPMPPGLPDQTLTDKDLSEDRVRTLAKWITKKENPFFARVMANRIWFHLMGRGLVEPVDDFRSSNPASNGPLLEAIAKDFSSHNFSQKHLIRRIMNSRAYQLSSEPTKTNGEDENNYARVQPRLLTAEQLLDSISQVTQLPETFAGYPRGMRASQLPGVKGAPKFLSIFGRPARLIACECERQNTTTLNQAFTMISSNELISKVERSPRITRLLKAKASYPQVITEFYLASVSRYPTEKEIQTITTRLNQLQRNRRQKLEDLLWVMINTKEFVFRR